MEGLYSTSNRTAPRVRGHYEFAEEQAHNTVQRSGSTRRQRRRPWVDFKSAAQDTQEEQLDLGRDKPEQAKQHLGQTK